ncbi:hypothetical protein ABD76_25835 [Paenibacillus dendritiformis]|uniref:hypothetical protein n=1 Tax=Paenibacillus dendritiformis TaxID=130049 RepID=UPI0018CD8803|nr:hypothetical protein [Paenibacillus dendritiformis]MBG9795697.1 hypothetical protein [Paenibacillus dendritiformis]
MTYFLIEYEQEEYWIEVGTDGYALRQIIVDNDKNVHVSCLEDCLAEGSIDENELDGTINLITQHDFEDTWNKATLTKRKVWEGQKMKNPIGKEVRLKVAYKYPQGWVLKSQDLIGIYSGEYDLSYGTLVKGRVSGYDEINMWLKISDIKIDD